MDSLIGDVSLRLIGVDGVIGDISVKLLGADGLIGDVSLRLLGASLAKKNQSSSEWYQAAVSSKSSSS